MLRPKPQLNLENAREYFREHLSVGDYYSEGQKITGEWLGLAAEKLGLNGPVGEKEFLALCEGRHPETGKRLTQRLNTVRNQRGKMTANRRIFHDFTISPPKSVSVVALYQDARIVEEHNRAVRVAMTELEKLAETRVRKTKKNGDRVTGNIVAACFRHDTSRELDPHLHTHCVVFNATHDPVEGRWKALQTGGMYRAQKFAENLYFHELAKGLRSLGYDIENNARNFEIRNFPRALIDRFSKRHQQIEAEAERQKAEGYTGDMGALRTRVAHEQRRRKIKNSTADELRSYWAEQLAPSERIALNGLCHPDSGPAQVADLRVTLAWAESHLFERRSVVYDYELMSLALARARGEGFDLSDLSRAIAEGTYGRRTDDPRKLVSRELYRCETEISEAALNGRNCFHPFARDYQPDPSLSAEQANAVQWILGSHDFITLFRGGAGTGKSRTLKEIHAAIAAKGTPVLVLAPQRQQVQSLQDDGLPARTLAEALAAKEFPPYVAVILDEAGQVGGRELRELFRLVEAQRGRFILSGDTRQHGAVAASDALRVIEKQSFVRVAELSTIRRQDPDLALTPQEKELIRHYRSAVKWAAAGRIFDSFDRLDRHGFIRELPEDGRRSAVAAEYLAAIERGEWVLAVAQTWSEVHAVNDAIRAALRSAGRLDGGTVLTTYQPLDRTEAEKRDPRFYEEGQSAVFVRRYGRFRKGDVCAIAAANERGVALVKDGRRSMVGFRYVGRFTVAKAVDMEIAAGDRLLLKANGRNAEGKRLHNGELVTVRNIGPDGTLAVSDDRGMTKTLAASQRMLVRGYAVTSYASQGKTVDMVILSDSGNAAATNRKQWYVSISRGRRRVMVLTSDKEALRYNIERSGERELATEERASFLPRQHLHMRVPGRSQRVRDHIELAIRNEAQRHRHRMKQTQRVQHGP